MNGNEPGKFGAYEFVKSLNWKGLAIILLASFIGWLGKDVIPQLQDQGGLAATVGGLLGYAGNALLLLIKDNSGKSLK